jgi:streptogramin lyase
MKIIYLAILALAPSFMVGQSLNNIESVEYDPINDAWLVSNGSSIISQDHFGNHTYFSEGVASAGYGMEVIGGNVFVIKSSGALAGYDLTTGEEIMSLPLGMTFPNGMATDGVSRLWVTDFSTGKIGEIDVSDLDNPALSIVVSFITTTPNGIVYDGANDRLLFVNWSSNAPVTAVDLSDYSTSVVINTGVESCDGIDDDNDGNWFISSWSPTRITKYSPDFASSEIITVPGLSMPADISYSKELDSLAIPNVGTSEAIIIGFGPTSIDDLPKENGFFNIYPNPVTDQSAAHFSLATSANVKMEIRDVQGKLITTLVEENLAPGKHRILFAGLNLEKGYYICNAETEGNVFLYPFLVQ